MKEGPDIAMIGALLGDPARANILIALLGGQPLTAGELAREAGVSAQTASGHLGRLHDGGLLAVAKQGRHRYYSLSSSEVAALLEQVLGLAARVGATRTRPGPRDLALREARVCYDHLAGERAVILFERLHGLGALSGEAEELGLTARGLELLSQVGVELDARSRRPVCRACFDWSERKPHLAGQAGAGLLDRFMALGWVRRSPGSRAVSVTFTGASALDRLFLP